MLSQATLQRDCSQSNALMARGTNDLVRSRVLFTILHGTLFYLFSPQFLIFLGINYKPSMCIMAYKKYS